MYYSVNDDGRRPRQIVLDVLEEGKDVLRHRDDANREGRVTKGDATLKRGKGDIYGKRNVRHGEESCKSVEELAESCPFPLAPEKRNLCGKGVI
jgi:hypothetical protein